MKENPCYFFLELSGFPLVLYISIINKCSVNFWSTFCLCSNRRRKPLPPQPWARSFLRTSCSTRMSSGEIWHFHTKNLQNYFVKNAEQKLKIFAVEKHIEFFPKNCNVKSSVKDYQATRVSLQPSKENNQVVLNLETGIFCCYLCLVTLVLVKNSIILTPKMRIIYYNFLQDLFREAFFVEVDILVIFWPPLL